MTTDNTQTEGERREKWRVERAVGWFAVTDGAQVWPFEIDASEDGEDFAKRLADRLAAYLNALESAASRGDRAVALARSVQAFIDYQNEWHDLKVGSPLLDFMGQMAQRLADFEREKGGG